MSDTMHAQVIALQHVTIGLALGYSIYENWRRARKIRRMLNAARAHATVETQAMLRAIEEEARR